MEKQILYLVQQLRKAGVRVTLAETLDSLEALRLVEWDRDSFYATLQATLVKNQRDYRVFDKLFGLIFDPDYFLHRDKTAKFRHLLKPKEGPDCQGEPCDGSGEGKSMGGPQQGQGRPGTPAQRFVQVIKMGNQQEMMDLIREGLAGLGTLTEKHLEDREDALRRIKVFLEWKTGELHLEKQAGEVDEETFLDWQARLAQLEQLLVDALEAALVAEFKERALEDILERHNLNQMDFYQLSQEQVVEMKRIITRLAHKLATRVSRRMVRAKGGKMDIQRTMRKSMASGGIPINPAYRTRKPTKPQLVVLCDISGSVKVFSEFMLQLVYSMQQKFAHVRSFVFVDTVDEITVYFHNREVAEAMAEVYNRAIFSQTGFSDYGKSILEFRQRYGNSVNGKTTVIILGDGRNNYRRPELEHLQWIKDNAKKVFWLNPEPQERWNKEDSIIGLYQTMVDRLLECRNMGQLERVVRQIF
ncbi:MAG: VWA domain-containing protein [Clostridia bacterium]|nr:VWA domain-containing protein [Clostridia bacterium]